MHTENRVRLARRCGAWLASALLTGLMTVPAGAATFFYDDFGGGTVNLNGTMPDITLGGATWVASPDFKASGAFAATAGGSATLAFIPVSGRIYTLDCSLSGVSGDSDWFALGFASGQSTTSGSNDRFIQVNVIGKAWMFIRGDASVNANFAYLGNATSGTGSGVAWTTYANQSGGAILMRIVLNTTGGAGNWTVTWYVKKPADAEYAVVRPATKMLNESINSVGFAMSSPTVQGTIESFTLSEGIPIVWSAANTSAVTTNSALASATVSTNVTDAVLVWDSADQGIASTNDWSYRLSLGAWSSGQVSGALSNLTTDARYTWRLFGSNTLLGDVIDGWSEAVTFATRLTDAQKPVFTNAAALSPNIIKLDWQDNAATETGYVLQRSTAEESGYATIAVLGAEATSYTDKVGLDEATVYYYQLATTNSVNGSGTDPALCRISAMTGAWSGRGALRGPYKADANTLHLWHIDEADPGTAQPAAGVTGSFILIPTNGAVLGAASYAGFGTAGDTSAAVTNGFQGSSVPVASVTGADGAFTFEALIRVANVASIQQILAMDNSGLNTQRPFQFRIDADTPSGGSATGTLRFINIGGASGIQTIITPLPIEGDHAFVPDQWFHAAVTYNGSENTQDNIKLYWTRMDARPYQANEIASTNMVNDLTGVSTILGVGNEYRGTPDNNLNGQIDEVRISNIARDPDRMMFYKIPGALIRFF